MMKNKITYNLLVCLLSLVSCETAGFEELDWAARSRSSAIIDAAITTSAGASSVTVTGYYRSMGAGVLRNGLIYSTQNKTPTIGGAGITFNRLIAAKTDTISYTLTALVAGNTYYMRMWSISTQSDTVYSNVVVYEAKARLPHVETMEVFNRVKKGAIVCGRMTSVGDGLVSYGCCISKLPLPTLSDTYETAPDTAKDMHYRGHFGVFFDNLEPDTRYHVRAYAITKTDTVYGNNRIFKTSKGGNLTWGWVNADDARAAGAYDRITIAMDSAKSYYDNYSNLKKYIYVQYNASVATADCNIEGWMRFGPSERYQWVGTAQHEITHAIGIGTASNWNGMFSNGIWKEYRAMLTLRVMMRDMTQQLHSSGVHFYNGGINQREEVTNGTVNSHGVSIKDERMLKLNALVVNAMRDDGLTSY